MSDSKPSIPMSDQDSSAQMMLDLNEPFTDSKDEGQNSGAFVPAESIFRTSQELLDEIRTIGLKIKQHEDNINMLKSEKKKLDEAIVEKQVIFRNYTAGKGENEDYSNISDEETSKEILQHESSAASILCQLMAHHGNQTSHLQVTRDVVGIVAKLGKVDDDNLNRLFSEYLGLENMMAIVCRTYEGVEALEKYNKEGCIDGSAGFQGLAASMGRSLEGRYRVICLERLRPYPGEYLNDDPQIRLNLLKPRLPNGECPPGFLGFAVNMIKVDSHNLVYVLPDGSGLRETLFYTLFSRLQVYKTRSEMLDALPLIREGALSLDGGIIRTGGIFSLGYRVDVSVRFSKSFECSNLPEKYGETENMIKEMKWKREKFLDDMQKERQLLEHAKRTFERRKEEYLRFVSRGSSYLAQHQDQAARPPNTPM